MGPGSWAWLGNGLTCGKSGSRSSLTCGSPDAGMPAPVPDPVAAQRPSITLREPAAQQRLWLMPPAPERLVGMVGRWLEGGKVQEAVEWALQWYGRGDKRSLDEERVFIQIGELFG